MNADLSLRLPRLRPDQTKIAKHPAKIKVVVMGRRWGKTVLGGNLALLVASQGAKAAWCVPTYKNGRPLWRWVEKQLSHLKKAGLCFLNRTERTVDFLNGGLLAIYSMDNEDSIRGEFFHLVVVDEAAKMSETAWSDAIAPTLADYDGDALLISTPRGRNWFWKEYQRGVSGVEGYASFNAPTSDNPNPNIKKAAELARQRVPERTYEQEWLAIFLDDGNGVFRRVRERATAIPQVSPVAGHDYVIGVDWGQENDFSVFCVIDATLQEQVYLERTNQVDYPVQMARLKHLWQHWKPQVLVAERNSIGIPIIQMLVREDIPVRPFNTTSGSKINAIESLALAFETDALKILPDTVAEGKIQIEELQAFEMTRTKTGLPDYHAPEGAHDDTVMALAICWQYAQRMAQ